MATTIIVTLILFVVGLIILLYQILKSNDDVDFKVNIKKGEMSVKKKRSQ